MESNLLMLQELEFRVMNRTSRRVRNLAIEMQPGTVILRGLTTTYYVKQLAQQEVGIALPNLRLENAIVVHGEN